MIAPDSVEVECVTGGSHRRSGSRSRTSPSRLMENEQICSACAVESTASWCLANFGSHPHTVNSHNDGGASA